MSSAMPARRGLATVSMAHRYNLRQRAGYQCHRQVWTKTRSVSIPIGERRASVPNNQPGHLRVDSVHQGDRDGVTGVYPITPVDGVTQYAGVATCERIREAFLIPVLEALLHRFPFVIKGFHSDNGSEYINRHVAQVLNKLRIEAHTKSRARHSHDPAQAESTNGSIVRKHLGDSPIPQRFPRQCVLPRSPQPLSQLPPPLPLRRNHDRRQGPAAHALSLYADDDAV